jgi:NAD(P)H-dependent FMN reductase
MAESRKGIRIAAVVGTTRPGNYTSRALALAVDEIRRQPGVTVEVLDPAGMDLPFPGLEGSAGDVERLREALAGSDGALLATPEYHGSYSSAVKLLIENLGHPNPLKGKPVALLGVAAGRLGAVKALEHLRSVCAHLGALVLPGSVSVADVQAVFDEEGKCLDEAVEKRIRAAAAALVEHLRGA